MNERSVNGSLFDRFFQLGYVTQELDSAMAAFDERFGPSEFHVINAEQPNIHTKRIALTWMGGTMIEIIEPNIAVPSIYLDLLPKAVGEIRLHHTGYLIDDYPARMQRLKAEGYAVPMALSYGQVLDCCYADARDRLGHYLEYVRLGDDGRKWFASIPGFQQFPPS
jgi:Glyoxalase/Bleomycin resistance protein/Dioxygenase superfamily